MELIADPAFAHQAFQPAGKIVTDIRAYHLPTSAESRGWISQVLIPTPGFQAQRLR